MSDIEKPVVHVAPVDVSPEEVGYDERAITRLDNHLKELVGKNNLQCASYLLARHGKIFAHKSMGKLTYLNNSSDFMPDSIRGIASVTKLFTAVAIMKLVEEGKIYLSQPVYDIIEEFNTDMHKKIFISHLLTHTSGLISDPGYFCEPYGRGWWERLELQKHESFPEKDKINWIKAILSGPLLCKPGEMWNYSTAGFMILGEIITRVSGVDCEQYIMDNIVKPLGMTETFFDLPKELHARVGCTNDWQLNKLNREPDNTNKLPRTGGGIYSTLLDLYKFGQMLLQKGTYYSARVLSRKAVEYMTRNHLAKNVPAFCWGGDLKEYSYGMGCSLATTDLQSPGTFNHEGAGRSMLYIDPSEDLLYIAFIPTNNNWVPESVINVSSIIMSGLI